MWHTPCTLEEALLLADSLSKSSLVPAHLRDPHNMLLYMGVAETLGLNIFEACRQGWPDILEPQPSTLPPGEDFPKSTEDRNKNHCEADVFREFATSLVQNLKDFGVEDAHDKLLLGYLQEVKRSSPYKGKKVGSVRDFDLLTVVYNQLAGFVPTGEDDDMFGRRQEVRRSCAPGRIRSLLK